MDKKYVLNLETSKIELSFDKETYKALSETDKKSLKSAFLFSGSRKAWVSRSTNNHYSAINTAEKLGFENGGRIGERLSYAEEVERKVDKAEQRIERFEHRADKAVQKAEQLQSAWKEASQDWSYVTQPIISGHSGSQRFARQRQKLIDRYGKGFEEYRKSDYYRDRAQTAAMTANMHQFKDRTYLSNRIEECNKNMRDYERRMIQAEEKQNQPYIEMLLDKMEYELDKLAYLHNKLDELGGIAYSKDNIKKGYLVQIRGSWDAVVKANLKTVEVKPDAVPYTLKYPYAEIQEIKIPDDWSEEKETFINPFTVNDVVVRCSYDGKRIVKAFQVVKATSKNVVIQEISINDNNTPVIDDFVSSKQERRSVKVSRGHNVVNYENWFLYKYQNDMTFASIY